VESKELLYDWSNLISLLNCELFSYYFDFDNSEKSNFSIAGFTKYLLDSKYFLFDVYEQDLKA
jgi:hypothetical protein